MELRIQDILPLRLRGSEAWEICNHVWEKEREPGSPWQLEPGHAPLTYSGICYYIDKCDRIIVGSLSEKREKMIRRHIAQRQALYSRCVQRGEYATAAGILRDQAKLLRLYPAADEALQVELDRLRRELDTLLSESGDPEAPRES